MCISVHSGGVSVLGFLHRLGAFQGFIAAYFSGGRVQSRCRIYTRLFDKKISRSRISTMRPLLCSDTRKISSEIKRLAYADGIKKGIRGGRSVLRRLRNTYNPNHTIILPYTLHSPHPPFRYLHVSLTTAVPAHGTVNPLFGSLSHSTLPSAFLFTYLYANATPGVSPATVTAHTGSPLLYPLALIATAFAGFQFPSAAMLPTRYTFCPKAVASRSLKVTAQVVAAVQAGRVGLV